MPLYDNAPLYSVTVPRDYDGVHVGGINHGDQMADRWEETVFGLPSCDTSAAGIAAVKGFNPFINTGARGQFCVDSIADRDTLAVGRGIRGDGLTNWEEYRGFWVTGDQNTYPYTTPQFQRMDPRHKTVFKAVSPRLERDLVSVMPAWDNLLYKPAFEPIDSNEYFDVRYVKLPFDVDTRGAFRYGRRVNPNHIGASFRYYGFIGSTSSPANHLQNAATFWEGDRDDLAKMRNPGKRALGITFQRVDSTGAAFDKLEVLNGTSRIVLDVLCSDSIRFCAYYNGGPGIWYGLNGDYYKLLKYNLTHEFGHALSLADTLSLTIMHDDTLRGGVPVSPVTGQVFYDPLWIRDFGSSDKSQTTIEGREGH